MAKGLTVLVVAIAFLICTLVVPDAGYSRDTLSSPSIDHWLGTDNVGRDIHHLAWRAAGSSIMGVLCAILGGLFVGCTAAIVISSSRWPWAARLITWLAAVLDSVGVLLPAIAFLSIYPRATVTAMGVLLGLLGWPGIAFPLARQIQMLQSELYVIAGRAMGGGILHQIRYHLLTPCLQLLIPLCASMASGYLAVLASLQFLGAFSASEMTIGSMLYEATTRIQQAPWCVVGGVASFAIALSIFSGMAYGFKAINTARYGSIEARDLS